MKKLNRKLLASLAMVIALPVFAQSSGPDLYSELGITSLNGKSLSNDYSLNSSPTTMVFTLGYKLTPYLAIETQLGSGSTKSNNDINWNSSIVTFNSSRIYGLLVKPSFSITSDIEVFGKIGYTNNRVNFNSLDFGSIDGLSYGVGATYNFNKISYSSASYMHYFENDVVKSDGLNISVGVRF